MTETAFHIREATPDDAERLIAHVRRIAEEPEVCVPMQPGEFKVTVEEERRVLADYAALANCVFLVANAGSEIVGILDCKGHKRAAMRHVTTLGITVRREWRGRGVGSALMARAIEWAKAGGLVTRLELEVYACNLPAIRLYERFGFVTEGRHPRSVVHLGKYEDNLTMALLL
jgi:ribosomal protein S18 acetylase RimI-like enzyme